MHVDLFKNDCFLFAGTEDPDVSSLIEKQPHFFRTVGELMFVIR